MINNNLLKILGTFSRKEMTYFEEFAFSPYFNKHAGVRALVQYLSEVYPKLDESSCERTVIYQALFPGKIHDQSHLALLFSYTLRLLEKFMAIDLLTNQEAYLQLYTARALRLRKLYRLSQKELKKFENKAALPAGAVRSTLYKSIASEEADRIAVESHPTRASKHIFKKQRYMDDYYCFHKLRDGCEILLRSKILKLENPELFKDEGFSFAVNHAEANTTHPGVTIYLQLYKMIAQGAVQNYHNVKATLADFEGDFTNEELQNIYNYLQNFCVGQINQGDELFLRELFQLYKKQLEKELLLDGGVLNEWHYKNIATVGIRLGETNWVQRFLSEFRTQLKPAIAENAYSFNLASLHYSKGNFEMVLQLLLQVEYTDPNYQLESKALLMRTYFDMEAYESLFSLYDSFRQLLQRNKRLSETRKKGYGNLFRLARKAAKIKYDLGIVKKEVLQKKLIKLQHDFEENQIVFNASWLRQKIELLREDLA